MNPSSPLRKKTAGLLPPNLSSLNLTWTVATLALSLGSGALHAATDSETFTRALAYTNQVYSKNHMIVMADIEWTESQEKLSYRYDRYPDVERLVEEKVTFARKSGGEWLKSEDWAKTGEKVAEEKSAELNVLVSTVDAALHKNLTPVNAERSIAEIVERRPQEGHEWVIFETRKEKTVTVGHPQFVFSVRGKDEEGLLIGYAGYQKSGDRELYANLNISVMFPMNMVERKIGEPIPKTQAAPAAGQEAGGDKLDVSAVVTKADAERILGVPVKAPKGRNNNGKDGKFYDSGWTYSAVNGDETLMLDFLYFDTPNLDGMFSVLPPDGGPSTKVDGLGDKAIFYHDKTTLDILNVLKGKVLITIGIKGLSPASALEHEKAEATKILKRMSEMPAATFAGHESKSPPPAAALKLPAPETGKVYGFMELTAHGKELMGKVVPVLIAPKPLKRKTDLHNGLYQVTLWDVNAALPSFGFVGIEKEALEKLGLEDGSAKTNQTIYILIEKDKLSGTAKFRAVGRHFEKGSDDGGAYTW